MYTSYGTTESGSSSHAFKRTKEDEAAWAYMEFGAHTNIRWMPQGDGTYECQFQVSSLLVQPKFKRLTFMDQACETHTLAVENLPDIRGYATSDLFVRHPTKDYLWKL